jgi:uncharacterized protein YjbJ (UPF0337 family)
VNIPFIIHISFHYQIHFLELKKMISLQQLRRFFLTIISSVMLAVIAFASADSLTAISFTQLISQPQTQIATMHQADVIKNTEGKAQEAVGDMTGNLKTQAAGKAKQFKAKTLEQINNSIENPNYKPGGKTKQAEREDRRATEDIEAKARENFN